VIASLAEKGPSSERTPSGQGDHRVRAVHRLLCCCLATGLMVATVLGAGTVQAREPTPESRQLAAEVPIFDMHLHVYSGLTPSELETRMNRNGVRWGGGVGAVTPQADMAPFLTHLSGRYFPTLGQPEMAASYMRGGVGEMGNPDNPLLARTLQLARDLFPQRAAFGFGELILNNQNSSPHPPFRRLAPIDSPVVRQMFALAAEHGVIVQIHMEPHEASLRELRGLLQAHPNVPVVISHCLAVTSSPREMESLFEASPQVHCELSARTQTYLTRKPEAQVFGPGFAKADWLASIERYAERYMVGSDATAESVNYDDEIRQIRTGLLPRLSPATLVKVAHGNAKRLMKVVD
jgi:hypothetical protein